MIKLDKWESQFVHLAKGWFDKEPYNKLSLQKQIKVIWISKCGITKMSDDSVNYYVGYFLIRLLEKVKYHPPLDIADFVMRLAPHPHYPLYLSESKYNGQSGFLFNIVKTILYQYLMVLQVKDSDFTLVQLEPIDYSIFDQYLQNKEKLPKWDEGKYITLMSARNKSLRKGQAIFLAVAQDYPELVDQIVNTDYDCFHDDNAIPQFLDKMKELINDA